MLWHFRILVSFVLTAPLISCASVSVIPLDYQGQPKNEAPGVRYYMPKPYLLVTQLPDASKPDGGNAGAPAAASKDEGGQGSKATDSPSPSSDLSYQLGNSTYLLKLIYLPDMSKTMAINVVPGIFGTSSAQPTLQDGWMLTSLQSSSDNTKAIDNLTSLASALIGGGAKEAATGGAAAAAKKTSGPGSANRTSVPALRPGLYEFRYDEYGHLIGLCLVTAFSGGVANTNLAPSDIAGVDRTGRYCPSIDAVLALNIVRVKG
jgi:hypothetical protein